MGLSNGGDDFDPGEDSPIVEQMRKIGKLGGNQTYYLYGIMHFVEAGYKGGVKTLEKHGREYYVELGRKGGLARAAKRKALEL